MNKANKTYTLGVLGLGEGRSIISAALNSTRWKLLNICDLKEDLCRERAQEFGLQRYTVDYNDMLKDETIDVIGIYTPDQLHGRHIHQALEAGKHVICTKPLLSSVHEAKELIDIQKKYPGHVFVGQSSRFFEPMLKQRRDYEEGYHGELVAVETHYKTDARWFLNKSWSRNPGFSWMYNFMIHAVDLARWYLADIAEVYGSGVISSNTTEYGLTCYDTMRFIVKDSMGRMGDIGGSYATPCLKGIEPTISCTLRGTEGISRAEYAKLEYHTNFGGNNVASHSFYDKHKYYFRFEGESHHAGEYQNYIDYFAEALDKGLTPKPDLQEGIMTIAVLSAMEKSLEAGLPVKVNDILKEHHLI